MAQTDTPKTPVGADLILPVSAAAYAIYYVWSVRNFPTEAQISGFLLAGLLLLFVLLYFVRIGLGLASGRYSLGIGKFLGPRESVGPRVTFFALIVVSMIVIPWLGFTLTTFLFLLASFLVLGVRPIRRAFLVAGVAALGGWLFFIVLLSTRFPQGPFERAAEALF